MALPCVSRQTYTKTYWLLVGKEGAHSGEECEGEPKAFYRDPSVHPPRLQGSKPYTPNRVAYQGRFDVLLGPPKYPYLSWSSLVGNSVNGLGGDF